MVSERMAQEQSRRSVLVGALHCAALGAIAVVGGLAVAKRRRLIAEGKCINDGICHGCAILTQCGLPDALAARQYAERGNDGPAK